MNRLNELLKDYPIASDAEIAEAGYTVLNEYRWRPFPTQPDLVKEHYKLPPQVRKRMNVDADRYKDFWSNPEVMNYFDQRQEIRNLNWRNENFLKWMIDIFGEESTRGQKIKMMISVFEDYGEVVISNHPEPINTERQSKHWEY
jgi:hypothetical protein